MLRALVLVLLALNALLLATNLGWLGQLGASGWPGGAPQREPERLARQVNPQSVTTLPGSSASAAGADGAQAWPAGSARAGASATAGATGAVAADAADADAPVASATPGASSAPPVPAGSTAGVIGAAPAASPALMAAAPAASCLQAAPLRPEALRSLTRQLASAGLREDSWRAEALAPQPSFLIFMGRYGDPALLQKKQAELKRRQVTWTVLEPGPAWPAGLTPGLGLGRYSSEAAADAALARLEGQGVRTARVVELPPVPGLERLVLPALSASQAAVARRVPVPELGAWSACGNPANASPT